MFLGRKLLMHLDGQPILATGASNGSIATWDLSKGGRLLHVNREAHEQGVSGLEFVPGQQLLISSSGDNSVKVYFVRAHYNREPQADV
jgi:U3 small nucleolar RNA-associated protein 21